MVFSFCSYLFFCSFLFTYFFLFAVTDQSALHKCIVVFDMVHE